MTERDRKHKYPTLREAARYGDLDRARELLAVSKSKANRSAALREAAAAGHIDIVRELIPVSDPRAGNYDALKRAMANGHKKVVDALTQVENQELNQAARNGSVAEVRKIISAGFVSTMVSALHDSAEIGHLDVVREIAPHVQSVGYKSDALVFAARWGHVEVVRELIPLSDPTFVRSVALQEAAQKGHLHVVNLLLPVSAYDDLPRALSIAASQEIRDLIQAAINAPTRNAVMEVVSDRLEAAPSKKKKRGL